MKSYFSDLSEVIQSSWQPTRPRNRRSLTSSGRRVQVLLHEKTELIISIVQVLVPSAAIGPVMFSKLVMFPLSASNEPEKEDLKELNGKLNDFHEMVSQLEAVESTMNDDHIIPAGVDVVVEPKKQDKKKSSAAKLEEEMDILDEEVKEIEVKLKDHFERINRLEEIKSTLMNTIDVERYWLADTEQMQLRVGLRATLKKPRDVERYVQADAEQMQLRLAVQAIMEIVEKKKEELEDIWKRMNELEERKSDSAETI